MRGRALPWLLFAGVVGAITSITASAIMLTKVTRDASQVQIDAAVRIADVERLRALRERTGMKTANYFASGDPYALAEARAAEAEFVAVLDHLRSHESPDVAAELERIEESYGARGLANHEFVHALQSGADPQELQYRREAELAPIRAELDVALARGVELERARLETVSAEAERLSTRWTAIAIIAALCGVLVAIPMAITAARALHRLGERARGLSRELERLFAMSIDLVCVLRSDGTFARVNPAFAELLGQPAADLRGRSAFEFIAAEDRERTMDEGRGLVPGAATQQFENRYRDRNGDYRRLSWRAVADDDGLIYAIARDITDERAAQDRLHAAQRMAALGQMAAGVAHEINNPLQYALVAVQLANDMVQRGQKRDEIAGELVEARDGMARVARIVADLRAFTRGDPPSALEPVDVRQSVRWAAKMAAPWLQGRARLELDLDDVSRVLATDLRLGQVIVNLLVNAAQAIEPGAIGEIRVKVAEAPRGRVAIEVRDDGRGMTPEVRERLFEPFFSVNSLGVGLGLGLAVCERIVASFGGTIEVESELGRGTVFRVLLAEEAMPQSRAS